MQSPPKLEVEEKPKGRSVLFYVNILLLLLVLALLGYIAVQEGYIRIGKESEQKTEQQEEKKEEETKKEETTSYKGEFVSATLPEGWSVVEYKNGKGSDMLSEGTYTGITGLAIFNMDKKIFSIEGVYGIGFESCPEIPRFTDYSKAYEDEIEKANKEMGTSTKYLNYADTEYSEYEWLGETIRRVDRALYYDNREGSQYFEPQCARDFISIDGLSFKNVSDNYEGKAFHYEISQDVTNEELQQLDKILGSMKAV